MFQLTDSRTEEAKSGNAEIWGNMKQYYSSISKILHDPECQDQCCGVPAFVSKTQLPSKWEPIIQNSPNSTVGSPLCVPINYPNQLYCSTISCNVNPSTQYENFYKSISSCRGNSQDSFNRHREWNKSVIEHRNQNSYGKGVEKRKRKRTAFTTEQIVALEEVFRKRPYVSLEERRSLTNKLNVNEKAIKIWFQNRRRLTDKREREQSDSYNSDSTVEDVSSSTNSARLDYIESHIYRNTDEKGFVTLDSIAMSELINVIDNVLSPNIEWNRSFYKEDENLKQTESYLMYEPISPVSLTDKKESEDVSSWQPSVPEESLQRLLDIQSALFS